MMHPRVTRGLGSEMILGVGGKSACATVLSVFLAGCTVGPKYSKAPVPVAPTYSEQTPASYLEAAGWKTSQPGDAFARGKWWEIFGDAQLNALEEQVGPANQTLKIAEANFRQARAQIKLNRSNLFPTITGGAQITHQRISSNNPTGLVGREFGNFVLPISVSYEPDLWGRIRRSVEAARESAQATAADRQNVKLELEADLALDYFDALSLDSQKRILDDNVIGFQRALTLTQNRYRGGIASKVEVAQAQTILEQTQAQDIDLGAGRAEYEHAIAVLIGKLPESFHLEYKPLDAKPPVIPTGVPSQLLERRPDIAAAERRMQVANQQIGIARAAFFPDLVISATGGLQSGSIVNWFTWPSRYWAVGPQVAQIIFDAGRRRAVVESSQATYDATVASYQQTSLTAFQEVEDFLAVLRVLEEEGATQHDATASAESSLMLSLNRYKGGLVTYLEVITAQNISLVNQRTEVEILRRRMEASVNLIRALGGGWELSRLPQV